MSSVFERIANANNHSDAYYTLDGDLNQMGIMERRLRDAGFKVVRSNVYPGFKKSDKEGYIKALKFLYDNNVEGWWGQRRAFIEHGICTLEEFNRKLGVKQ